MIVKSFRGISIFLALSSLLTVADSIRGNYPCSSGKHYFTNCTDPCNYDDDTLVCKSNPTAKCHPDYCGGCVARFYDRNDKEIHCVTEDGVICEMMTHSFQCTKDQVINLKSANYGRTSKTTCLHPFGIDRLHNHTNCRSPNAMTVLSRLCHGKQMCTVTVESELFGSDPCYGIYKYLEVELECISKGISNGTEGHKQNSIHIWIKLTLILLFKSLINSM